MDRSCALPCSIITILVLVISCICLGLGAAVYLFFNVYNVDYDPFPVEGGNRIPENTPVVIRPTAAPTVVKTPIPGTPDPTLEVTPDGFNGITTETLKTLEDTIVPINDLRDLAFRLKGIENIPLTLEPPAAPLRVGEKKPFWVTNVDSNENFQVNATLRYVTDHLYFWIEDSVRFNQADLRDLAETFENQIYPTNREFFGSEWTPGVDGDPHLYVLFAGGLGNNLAGYFSSADAVHPLAHEYSNGHEMFLINADHYTLRDEYLYGVLAHEFQHMIHWYRDRNETSWLNEGFSELATFLNGFDNGGFDYAYTRNPDIQLNDWPNNPRETSPHYGASFLFVTYFLDRFGDDATKALVGEDENGLRSVDLVLEQIGAIDPLTGEPIGADDVFSNWVVASYLQDESVADGRYIYHNYPGAPQPEATERIRRCPTGVNTRDVRQYGVDYIRINCSGNYTLRFEGSTQVRVLPADVYSGDYAFWSNKGDESNMTLTRTFDFSEESGPIHLSYWTWYDLEKDYDYLYLVASLDGETWDIIQTPSSTMENPSGNSYGWGYNDLSDRGPVWIQENVDLSKYAGETVQLRFEYVTDAAVNGEGFLLDDVSIPEIDYFADFEEDDGGWQADGFVRIQNVLPQTYRLALISRGKNTTVEYFIPGPEADLEIPLSIGGDVEEAILVISGTTRFTREPAPYRFEITP